MGKSLRSANKILVAIKDLNKGGQGRKEGTKGGRKEGK
jgi:hypothetical protein